MKLSYGLTVKNEEVEIQRLLGFLLEKKREEDEIVVLFDSKRNPSNLWISTSSFLTVNP